MSADKSKPADKQAAAEKPVASATPAAKAIPPLFRRIDWLTMAIAFGVVWVVYFLTLAPEVTMEDSGELCTGSFYAGIPHPPGYPVWTLYTWLWTALLPFGNVGWRVALGEATASAFACGLVGLMVSRGSSMLLEGIEEFKNLTGKSENLICVVCGAAAGILLGMGGVMWSESVAINRISLFGVPWVMTVMLCMLRWIYAPQQTRYLFYGMFFFGICLTIHQTLLVAAMGIEVAVAACQPRLGRTFFLGNSIIFIVGLLLHNLKLTNLIDTGMILNIFYAVGIASIAAYFVFAWLTEETSDEYLLDGATAMLLIGLSMTVKGQGVFYVLLMVAGLAGFITMAVRTWKLGHEWLIAAVCALLWVLGALFYFYEPIAGMTNPPMQWGYPRTVEGFWHAFSRGQYEKVNPTDVFGDPHRFGMQLEMLWTNLVNEYTLLLVPLAIVPFWFFMRMKKRERSWLACVAGIYLCVSVLLIILMNPSSDHASTELHQVFFTSSHAVFSLLIGYGLALTAAFMAVHYERFRRWGLGAGAVGFVLAIYALLETTAKHFLGPTGEIGVGELPHWIAQSFAKGQYAMPVFANLILLAIPLGFIGALLKYRNQGPLVITLALFAVFPLFSGLAHWGRSEQRNHWFGYWYGHDMFTPPFTAPDGSLSYDPKLREAALKGTNAALVYPEMARDAILYGGTDPGRFCPTYMVFCESFIPHRCQPEQDQNFDRRDVYVITQNALADGTYLEYIRAHYHRSAQIDPPFFQQFLRGEKEVQQNVSTNLIARLAYNVLDRPFTSLGANIEARRRREGVYPPKEIYTPSGEEGRQAAIDYLENAARRFEHDRQFPGEPKQMRPGENISVENGRVSYGGQVSVMAVNGLLTRIIFDRNPKNEFYVEESYPMEWMYPYLTPFGVIMKVNREPLASLTDDMIRRDSEFWSRYSDRLIGNWVTHDTSLKEIIDFVDKVYFRHDFSSFKGDRKFLRDEDAQKYFSHFRTCIASSVYFWRFGNSKDPAERARMLKEADFAYRQAFAYAPFNPEVVFHYVTMLAQTGRFDDALLVAGTCLKLDPNNGQLTGVIQNLSAMKNAQTGSIITPDPARNQQTVQAAEKAAREHPDDFQSGFRLAGTYMQLQQPDKAVAELDRMLNHPKADANVYMSLVQAYSQLSIPVRAETALQKLIQVDPDSAEAWENLCLLESALGKTSESLTAMRHCLEANSRRLAKNPKAVDILATIGADKRFDLLRRNPEFQSLLQGK